MNPEIITAKERLAQKKCNTCGKKLPMNTENKLPSNWQMFKNLVQAAADAVASGLDVRGPEETEKALKICAECPRLVDDGGSHRCGECGCVLQYKVKLKAWHCPLNKW